MRGAARLLDLDVVDVPGDPHDRLTGAELRTVTTPAVCAVVASAGATNTGRVDDLAGVADVCARRGWWLHVDAAYGGAALAVPRLAGLFDGIERADSVVVDPHKWLFAPLDCAAVLYRDPDSRPAHPPSVGGVPGRLRRHPREPVGPRFHLTCRARGLPFWFSLVVHGTAAHADAIGRAVDLASDAAAIVRDVGPPVRLVMDPQLSVVLFERDGWTRADWDAWAASALADGLAFVAPTTWQGRAVRSPRVPPPAHRPRRRRPPAAPPRVTARWVATSAVVRSSPIPWCRS